MWAQVLEQASQVFLSDQLCPVALILQVLKAGNVSYQLYALLLYSESCIRWWNTQTRMKTREQTLREKQAIWMLKENRKSTRAIAKTKGMEKSRDCKPTVTPAKPATNNDLIGWENNSSWWQTNKKSCENEQDVSVKSPTTSRKLGWCSDNLLSLGDFNTELQMLHGKIQTSDQHQK